jgi:hypothetical protein
MTTPETLRRFAADCERMGKLAKSRESRTTWGQLAVRWNRCAELAERHLLAAHANRLAAHTNRETMRSRRGGRAEAA